MVGIQICWLMATRISGYSNHLGWCYNLSKSLGFQLPITSTGERWNSEPSRVWYKMRPQKNAPNWKMIDFLFCHGPFKRTFLQPPGYKRTPPTCLVSTDRGSGVRYRFTIVSWFISPIYGTKPTYIKVVASIMFYFHPGPGGRFPI